MKLHENVGWGIDRLTDKHGRTVGRMLRMGSVVYRLCRKTAVNESFCVCGLIRCDKGCLCDCEVKCHD